MSLRLSLPATHILILDERFFVPHTDTSSSIILQLKAGQAFATLHHQQIPRLIKLQRAGSVQTCGDKRCLIARGYGWSDGPCWCEGRAAACQRLCACEAEDIGQQEER